MPRPSKGPRLAPQKRNGKTLWIIRDGQRNLGTGCVVGKGEEGAASLKVAQEKLSEYTLGKRDPKEENRGSDLAKAPVADALSYYMSEKIDIDAPPSSTEQARKKHEHRRRAGVKIIERLNQFFGKYSIPELKKSVSKDFAAERGSQSSARRELEVLQAAVNYFVEDEVGGVQTKFRSWLPDQSQPRERWLTRSEAARLIWAAWRQRENRGGEAKGRYTSRHIARFILVGLYTGTRASAICGAALTQAIGRGYVDLEHGIFVRKGMGVKETNKRQPTIPLPPRLLAHMRRWNRLGISKHSVIEWQGEPVERVSKGWLAVREAAGLDDLVIPHTLRHTAITWYLRSGKNPHQVSDYCGVSMQIINRHYKHHMPGGFSDGIASSARLGRA
jgi:integrase